MSRGRVAGQKQSQDANVNAQAQAGTLNEADLAELWEWAPVEANQEARRRNWGGNYTLEERETGVENVVTGLRRELEDDDEEEEEEADNMEIVGARKKASGGAGLEFDIAAARPAQHQETTVPAMPLDDVLRFMTTGTPPTQR